MTNDTRTKILDTTIDLFSIHGFRGVSIRDIARAVGIKESSIYNHFPSKDALLEEIFNLYDQAYARMIPSQAQAEQVLNTITPEQFWKNGFRNFKEIIGAPRMEKMARILTLEMYHSPRAREMMLKHTLRDPAAFTEAIFRKLIERGQIKPLDPRMLAFEFQSPLFTLYMEYILLHSAGEDTQSVEQQVQEHIHFFSEFVKSE